MALPKLCAQLIIGIGNLDRGDDGVGRLVARWLRTCTPETVRVEESDGEVVGLVEAMGTAESVVLIDAAVSGAAEGTIHVIDCSADVRLPVQAGLSSHGLGVAEAVALARLLHAPLLNCRLYAIEAARFVPGSSLSPKVRAAGVLLSMWLAHQLWRA